MTNKPSTTTDSEYTSGWTSNPMAITIAKLVADRCSDRHKNDSPKAPYRYAIIHQAAGMGAHQMMTSLTKITNEATRSDYTSEYNQAFYDGYVRCKEEVTGKIEALEAKNAQLRAQLAKYAVPEMTKEDYELIYGWGGQG